MKFKEIGKKIAEGPIEGAGSEPPPVQVPRDTGSRSLVDVDELFLDNEEVRYLFSDPEVKEAMVNALLDPFSDWHDSLE